MEEVKAEKELRVLHTARIRPYTAAGHRVPASAGTFPSIEVMSYEGLVRVEIRCYDVRCLMERTVKEGKPMSATSTVQDLNRELARRINAEARSNPQSPYANKFVGIANGQVVVVTDDLDDLARRIRQAEPDPSKTLCLEASYDYDEVHEIWGLI